MTGEIIACQDPDSLLNVIDCDQVEKKFLFNNFPISDLQSKSSPMPVCKSDSPTSQRILRAHTDSAMVPLRVEEAVWRPMMRLEAMSRPACSMKNLRYEMNVTKFSA